jgi:S-DNA-T family DNA segregation ATPase FtsK/SpoIIIE
LTSKNAKKAIAPVQPNAFLAVLMPRLREAAIIGQVLLALLLATSLLSYHPEDPGWTYTGSTLVVSNAAGAAGAWVADVLFVLFGLAAYGFPLLILIPVAKQMLSQREDDLNAPLLAVQAIGLGLTVISFCLLFDLHFYSHASHLREQSGGILGQLLAQLLLPALSYVGTTISALALALFGLTLIIEISWLSVIDRIGAMTLQAGNWSRIKWSQLLEARRAKGVIEKEVETRKEAIQRQVEHEKTRAPLVIQKREDKKPEISQRAAKEKQGNLFKTESIEGLPALSLLDEARDEDRRGLSEDNLEAMSRLLELKLKDYGIDAEVVAVFPGPVITRFEILPAAGVKVSRISGLAKDLARSLAVISVRVVEVIPGKPVVGIEIPNEDREIVRLSQVLTSKAYDDSASALTLALGHDIAGAPIVTDLAKMPHLLVAGTTGSGKSVGLNAMLLSLLFKASPEEVRLIMVDPKMLELAVYEGIPHLLTPVVTDMKDAANALRWCVAEMERRYRLMAALGVRNMSGFNRKVKDGIKAGEPILDPLWVSDPLLEEPEPAPALEPLPYIVVVIDEFADMMMIVGKKVEELIARIAQKARAAGIHLVLATQRPSVDVITGLIKANVPTRIAFQVSSKVDSRTILDQGGAEQLLGHGDMLYLPSGSPIPVRVHGAFVDDDEVHRVVESWKALGEPNYLDTILDARSDAELLPGSAGGEEQEDGGEEDALYDEAVAFVTESGRASISAVQRKFRIGYNRAARMVEEMERAGVVSPMNSNGSREVLAHAPPE